MTFGKYITDAIDGKGWTQQRLAAELSCPASNVSRWCTGAQRPSSGSLDALVKTLELDPRLALDLAAQPLEGTVPAKEGTS